MKGAADKILAGSPNYKGGFAIDCMPEFVDSSYPHSYLIFVDSSVFFAVVVVDSNTAVIFNSARRKVSIPPELIAELSYLYTVTLINGDITENCDHMFGICLFFLYFCTVSISLLPTIFPPNNTYSQHYLNIHDFLKVQYPCKYNKW